MPVTILHQANGVRGETIERLSLPRELSRPRKETSMKGLVARMQDVAVQQSEELLKNVPGVRDGDADAIHDARVATRRIRALLEVLGDDESANHAALTQEMRTLGRALGAARDLDVIVELFEDKIWQVPEAARAVVALSRVAVHERANARRDLIKTIERSPLADFAPSAFRRLRAWRSRAAASIATNLRRRMHTQSTRLSEAVEHASGVYFPNRAHEVRIHSKRLRYLVELASPAKRPRDDRELTVLKRVQSVLGHVHDRELIIQRLEQSGGAELETLRQRVIAERDDLFKDYLSRRDDVREVSDSIRRRTAETTRNWMPMAALLAVPSALVVGLVAREKVRASVHRGPVARPMERRHDPGRSARPRGDLHPRPAQ
jgi:CHAD domain-containing protein